MEEQTKFHKQILQKVIEWEENACAEYGGPHLSLGNNGDMGFVIMGSYSERNLLESKLWLKRYLSVL